MHEIADGGDPLGSENLGQLWTNPFDVLDRRGELEHDEGAEGMLAGVSQPGVETTGEETIGDSGEATGA
jgi:hypothetical protein